MSVVGGQLQTYNSNLPITTSGTAGTTGLIVYPQSADGVNAGITNAPAAGTYYDGITHFKNICGINSINIGVSGAEIPLTDKQSTQVYTSTSVSVAATGYVVAPFQATLSGYWTAVTAAPALASTATIQLGSAGTTLVTITPTTSGGSAGDTYSWTAGTAVISGGQPLSINVNSTTTGTAYVQQVTCVFTRVGI